MTTHPSKEGLSRYPPKGKRNGVACTCYPTCDFPCSGRCGCLACKNYDLGDLILDALQGGSQGEPENKIAVGKGRPTLHDYDRRVKSK
jgi:hypothetical protein